MMLNDPAIVEEVRDAFERYETALLANDADVLDAMFVHRDDTVRFGVAEVQYGIDEIRQFRAMQRPFTRRLERLAIVSYGGDVAV
ncbi:MAG TPA: AtzH-like domain-containing protein, partial [Devosia sp.]